MCPGFTSAAAIRQLVIPSRFSRDCGLASLAAAAATVDDSGEPAYILASSKRCASAALRGFVGVIALARSGTGVANAREHDRQLSWHQGRYRNHDARREWRS